MDKLRFQTRLILGFSILLIANICFELYAIVQIQSISSDTELIYNHPLTVSNSVRDINTDISVIRRLMKDVVLSDNSDQLEIHLKRINQFDSIIYNRFELVKARFLGKPIVVEDAYNAYKDWTVIRNEVVSLKKAGNDYAAMEIVNDRGVEQVRIVFDRTKKITDFAQNKADELYKKVIDKRKKSSNILIYIIILSMLLSTSLAYIISRSIANPIRKFIKNISRISAKNQTHHIEIRNKSEQEILLLSAQELKTAFEELQKFNIELDKKVEERTLELQVQNEEYAALNEEYITTNEELIVAKNKAEENEHAMKIQNDEYLSLAEEYKTANEELTYAIDKAEESDRLKTEFINNLSHEIRTPMNGILGFSSFLDKPDLSEIKRKQYVQIIQNSGDQLLRTIDSILEISELGTKQVKLHIEEFCLNNILFDLFAIFDIKAKEKQIPLYFKRGLSDAKSVILTDRHKLNKILSNLLENALRFTHNGYIELGYTLKDNTIIIYVKDTGIGINVDKREVIFNRFSQEEKELSQKFGGLGLGLSIAKENAELLGGDITLESEKGKGSTFYVRFPYKPGTTLAQESKADGDVLPQKEDLNSVLVVEDEEINYLYIEKILESEFNCTIYHAKNGKEAIDICNSTSIQVILMDLKMPVMNGFDATKEIKELYPDIPIIAQTAYASKDDMKKAILAGCSDCICKPIKYDELVELIKKHSQVEVKDVDVVN